MRIVGETLLLSHEVQKELLCILNFSEGSSDVDRFKLSPRPLNSLCLKDCMCTVNPLNHLAKISSMLIITYRPCVTARNFSALKSNLERYPCSRGEAGMQSVAKQESLTAPGLPTAYGV